jgi:hypothetical protein
MIALSENHPDTKPLRFPDRKVRVAVIGVGNCASSLVQGVHFYRQARENETVPGLMHVNLGRYLWDKPLRRRRDAAGGHGVDATQ